MFSSENTAYFPQTNAQKPCCTNILSEVAERIAEYLVSHFMRRRCLCFVVRNRNRDSGSDAVNIIPLKRAKTIASEVTALLAA